MKKCAIFVNPQISKTTKIQQKTEMIRFAHHQGYSVVKFITNSSNLPQYLVDENIDLLIVYSLKSFSKTSGGVLSILKKIIDLPSLNFYVFTNKMYAKDVNLNMNFQFNIILDVLSLIYNIETKQHTC